MSRQNSETDTGTKRIDTLARPKPVPLGFQQDRRSLYWVDRLPPNTSEGGTVIVASARVQDLSLPRTIPNNYKEDRPTPIWLVSSSAQKTTASERVENLSKPKPLHPIYRPDRCVFMTVEPAAKKSSSTARLDALAVPRQKSDINMVRDIEAVDYSAVSPLALKATATARVEQLAESKRYHPMFQEDKPIQWSVTDSATKALPTLRLQQLARPRSRTLFKDDYDPYKVPLAARRARSTPRVDELAVPFPRKVRKKLLA